MLHYESLFLAVPELTQDESKNIESQLDGIVNKSKGTIVSYDRWGKYQLAYPVRKNTYGVYFLFRFNVNEENKSDLLENIKNYFSVKQHNLVMRHMVSRIDSDAPSDYKRPESLEEGPARDVDTFLKENKMTGLLHKKPSESEETKVSKEKEKKNDKPSSDLEEQSEEK